MITGRMSGLRVAFFTQDEVDVLAQGRGWEGLPEWCMGRPLANMGTGGTFFWPDGCVAWTVEAS